MAPLKTADELDFSLVGNDLFCLLTATDTLGFVQKVGNVFVALSGDNLGHAVEVGQSHSWDRAVEMVLQY